MSRSGYSEECDGSELAMYRGVVASTIRGKRGQAFLKEMVAALDAMPVKELIADQLITADGKCCAIGSVCLTRGLDVSKVDYYDPSEVAKMLGITWQLVAEIEYTNDDAIWTSDPAKRWEQMRNWAINHIREEAK